MHTPLIYFQSHCFAGSVSARTPRNMNTSSPAKDSLMNKYKNYSRLSNPQLKHKQSEVGYHLYISNEAQKQLDQLSGHTKTRAYQTIQSLASDPYPGRSDGRLCVRTKNDVNYLVAHSIAVKFQRQSEHVLIDAVKSVDKQQAACDFASAGNTIGALQQELHFLESLSN